MFNTRSFVNENISVAFEMEVVAKYELQLNLLVESLSWNTIGIYEKLKIGEGFGTNNKQAGTATATRKS